SSTRPSTGSNPKCSPAQQASTGPLTRPVARPRTPVPPAPRRAVARTQAARTRAPARTRAAVRARAAPQGRAEAAPARTDPRPGSRGQRRQERHRRELTRDRQHEVSTARSATGANDPRPPARGRRRRELTYDWNDEASSALAGPEAASVTQR